MQAIRDRWTEDLRRRGAALADRMDPYFEDSIRMVYHQALGMPPENVPADLIAMERAKFHRIMRGDFGPEYLKMQEKITAGVVAAGLTYQQYMIGYAAYQTQLMRAYQRSRGRFAGDPGPAVELILLAAMCDTLHPLGAFFKGLEAEAAARRDALAQELEQAIGAATTRAARGDFSARVERRFDDPRLAAIAEGINGLAAAVAGAFGDVAAALSSLAAGDFSARMNRGGEGDFARLESDFNTAAAALRDLVMQVKEAASDIHLQAEGIAEGAAEVSRRASGTAASLEETSAGMAELNDNVGANAAAADEAAILADDASRRAGETSVAIDANLASMGRIEEGARRIADIVTLIDGIAFQTNLLALNAAVEAARAGEAGKGFAVVASEVRQLAQRSADSAKDIRQLIATSQTEVAQGVAEADATRASLSALSEAIEELKTAVRRISAATRQQAENISAIASSVEHVDRLTQDGARMVETSAASARQLTGASTRLEELVQAFRLEERADAPAAKRRAG